MIRLTPRGRSQLSSGLSVMVFPADSSGCGSHRLIWPSEVLIADGESITIVNTAERQMRISFDRSGSVVKTDVPEWIDVVVLQRVTHQNLIAVIEFLRERGIAVVVDIDDDLKAIHPSNPAWISLHPRNMKANENREFRGDPYHHSWQNLDLACRAATMVTVSASALLPLYSYGVGRVLNNYLADHYYTVSSSLEENVIGWPATLVSHPDDPGACGNAIGRLVGELGASFVCSCSANGVGKAFGLGDYVVSGKETETSIFDWPREISRLGIGIVPLSDTRFNRSKSWLKGLELSAVGVPWVGSPRAEYLKLHSLGAGVLCSRPRDWYRELKTLVNSCAAREELRGRGQEVSSQLRLRDNAWRWLEVWTEAAAIEKKLGKRQRRDRLGWLAGR